MSSQPDDVLDSILEDLLSNIPIKATEIGWEVVGENVLQAKQAIKALIDEAVREARIDELKGLIQDTTEPDNIGGKFIHEPVREFAKQLKEYMTDRIAELQKPTKENVS